MPSALAHRCRSLNDQLYLCDEANKHLLRWVRPEPRVCTMQDATAQPTQRPKTVRSNVLSSCAPADPSDIIGPTSMWGPKPERSQGHDETMRSSATAKPKSSDTWLVLLTAPRSRSSGSSKYPSPPGISNYSRESFTRHQNHRPLIFHGTPRPLYAPESLFPFLFCFLYRRGHQLTLRNQLLEPPQCPPVCPQPPSGPLARLPDQPWAPALPVPLAVSHLHEEKLRCRILLVSS